MGEVSGSLPRRARERETEREREGGKRGGSTGWKIKKNGRTEISDEEND